MYVTNCATLQTQTNISTQARCDCPYIVLTDSKYDCYSLYFNLFHEQVKSNEHPGTLRHIVSPTDQGLEMLCVCVTVCLHLEVTRPLLLAKYKRKEQRSISRRVSAMTTNPSYDEP